MWYTIYGENMEKKTHIMCANALSLFLVRPTTISSLALTISFATLGGLISDVDLKDSAPDKLFDKLMVSLVTIVIMSGLIKYFFDIDLYLMLKEYSSLLNYIVSISLFIVMAYLGSKSSHRTFTHSIIGCIVYTAILSYGFSDNIVIPFFYSYVSHIILDLFNMKGLTLLYPFKHRFCFKLCESSGKINKFLFVLFTICFIGMIVMLSIKV